ncbi:hypothetical protein F4860DRAFT_448403 [Xylaria cubensis]|nr:hypothetical protein F4860DRAFT_448403 [Xylaria cubensis]
MLMLCLLSLLCKSAFNLVTYLLMHRSIYMWSFFIMLIKFPCKCAKCSQRKHQPPPNAQKNSCEVQMCMLRKLIVRKKV